MLSAIRRIKFRALFRAIECSVFDTEQAIKENFK